jgi:GINS complex subunit 1
METKMLCSKSFELIKHLDMSSSNTHELAPYNDDCVRYAIEECDTLYNQNQVDVRSVMDGDSSNIPAIQMRHAALLRNRRCLLTYVYKRMNWIADLRFELASVILPRSIQASMSELERQWFHNYSKTLANYMKAPLEHAKYEIDLTQYTKPPKDLYIHVRCLQDYGEYELSDDGHVVTLNKDSQHYVLASDVDDLIRQGILEHIR